MFLKCIREYNYVVELDTHKFADILAEYAVHEALVGSQWIHISLLHNLADHSPIGCVKQCMVNMFWDNVDLLKCVTTMWWGFGGGVTGCHWGYSPSWGEERWASLCCCSPLFYLALSWSRVCPRLPVFSWESTWWLCFFWAKTPTYPFVGNSLFSSSRGASKANSTFCCRTLTRDR